MGNVSLSVRVVGHVLHFSIKNIHNSTFSHDCSKTARSEQCFAFLLGKGFVFSLFSDLITIFCYCIQFKNSVSLTQRQARQPDQNHVGAVLSTGSVHVPKLLSAPTVPSYTPVSLGWAKSKPCYAVLAPRTQKWSPEPRAAPELTGPYCNRCQKPPVADSYQPVS